MVILGNDCLTRYKAIIDHENSELHLQVNRRFFKFPLEPNIRIEYVAKIPVHFNGPQIYLQTQFKTGIIVGNSIVQPNNGLCNITAINPCETSQYFDSHDLLLVFDDLSNYHCINVLNSKEDPTRLDKLSSELEINHLNHEEKSSILDLCHEFHDIFYLPGDKLSHTNSIQHSIPLTTNRPVFVKPYRLPEAQKPEIQDQIQNMLNDDIIEHSKSPYNAPIIKQIANYVYAHFPLVNVPKRIWNLLYTWYSVRFPRSFPMYWTNLIRSN